MFDDYVEHASDPTPVAKPTYSLPNLQFEGFETVQYEDDRRLGESLTDEAYLHGSSTIAYQGPPMFELGRVQYTLPAPLVSLAVSSNILTMGLKSNTLLQLNLAQADNIITVTLPTKKSPTELTMYKVFNDPTGKHLLITTEQGENFYCYEGWTKARVLGKLKMVVESVAWNTLPSSASYPKTSTREILIGARNGTIYEAVLDAHDDIFKSQDRYLQPVFTLPEKHPITGIHYEGFASPGPGTPRRGAVIATTPTRIYQFLGPLDKKNEDGGKLFEALFEPYRSTAPRLVEIPGNLTYSQLHIWTPLPSLISRGSSKSTPQMAWLTGSGAYHGGLALPPTSDELVDTPSLIPYPPPVSSSAGFEVPISMCLTEFHIVLLYKDRVCALNRLNEELIWEEALPIRPGERPIGLIADGQKHTYWLYSDSSLFELLVKEEDRDVWRIYLEKSSFDLSLRYVKDPSQRAIVNSALAEHQFNGEQYARAAQTYAQSATSVEEVILAFSDLGAKGRDGLRLYLVARLQRCPKSDLTQRMLLATWLVEFYLSKINTLDDTIASESASHDVESLRVEEAILQDDLRSHLETYKANLDTKTVYNLILSHGRNDMFLYYASVVGDFGKVLEHHVMEEEWLKAVDVLNRLSDLDLYYRFSPVLMRNAPKEIVDSWIRQPALDPHRLVPAILLHQHHSPAQSPIATNHAIRYLQHIAPTSTSSTIHNLLLTLLITSSANISSAKDLIGSPMLRTQPPPDSAQPAPEDLLLIKFLASAPINPLTSKPFYDLDYALRLCKQYGRLRACVHIYAQMCMWEECIDLALEMGELELAKANCVKAMENGDVDGNPVDESFKKKLWLKVAKHVVQEKKDIKTAMRLLDDTAVLKIEDILPFFPDFVVIDDFKEEICSALEGYSAHIDTLKAEMDEATRSAESIKNDISELKNRFVTLEQTEQCSICSHPLLTRQFYLFPCQHTFHADCLIGQVKEYLPAHALRRLVALQGDLVRKQAASGAVTSTSVPSSVPNDRTTQSSLPRQPQTQRTLLSSAFTPLNPAGMIINPAARLASSLNPMQVMPKNALTSAGDRLRDLIVPDALANAIGASVEGMGMVWGGMGFGSANGSGGEDKKIGHNDIEKIKHELDELLAASCPLCEGVVAGLEKPFIQPGDVDRSWDL